MSSVTQIWKSRNSKYDGVGLTWTSKEMHPKAPTEGVGETLYVTCVTSMGLLCICVFMAMEMMSEKLKKKDRTLKVSI